MRRWLGVALVLATACGGGGARGGGGPRLEPTAPGVAADPPPGALQAYTLDVTVRAVDPDVEVLVALDEAPDPATSANWVRGEATAHLIRSATVQALVRDPEGRVWGPYEFDYVLLPLSSLGGCLLRAPARSYYRLDEPVPLHVDYSFPSALSTLELLVDGTRRAVFSDTENALGATTVTLPRLGSAGAHEVSCRVAAYRQSAAAGNTLLLHVDATPPEAAWVSALPDVAPTQFRVAASDAGGAGLARAELCDSTGAYCFPMQAVSGGFRAATAFVAGDSVAFSGVARVYDGAGNARTLTAAPVAAADIPTGAPPFVHGLAVTTAATLDLAGYLTARGLAVPAEVRSLAWAPVSPYALPLTGGWNEFVFRLPGAPGWESFGAYRAGVRAVLPPAVSPAWLAYASASTVPGLQARRLAPQPEAAGDWSRAWLAVPNLFFDADANQNGAWDDGEALYAPAATSAGPWLAHGAVRDLALAAAVTAPAAGAMTAAVQCATCAPGPALILQRRLAPGAAPVGRASWPGLDLAAAPPAAHAFAANAGERCLFFWDEDGNGAPSGDEPRAADGCDAGAFALARAAPLAVTADAALMRVSGIPYGGAVTGWLEVRDGAALLLARVAVPVLTDDDGTGERAVALPPEADWPADLVLFAGANRVSLILPGRAAAAGDYVLVDVRDEADRLVSAAVESYTPSVSDRRLFDAASGVYAGLAFDVQYRPRLRAVADGYLSEWAYVDLSPGTVRVRSGAAAGRVVGVVRDASGAPVAGATVTWDADPYWAETFTDSQGRFGLPALGSGTVTARLAGGWGSARRLTVAVGEVAAVQLSAAVGDVPADGIAGERPGEWLAGPSPATLYTGPAGVAASGLVPGRWEIGDGLGFVRAFEAPGALPPISLTSPAWLTLYWNDALMTSALTLRCGARRQAFAFGGAPLVDAPCWDWFAERDGRTYYLGRPDPVGGMPAAGLSLVSAWFTRGGVADAGVTVRFVERVFHRAVTGVTDLDGRITLALPHGYYHVETPGGTAYRDAAGKPAAIVVAGAPANGVGFYLP